MKYLILIITFLSTQKLLAQSNILSVNQIDSVINIIDTTLKSGGISEGTITSSDGHSGNFSDWYYTDQSGKHLTEVVYEEELYGYDFTHYYFYNDQLICVKFSRGNIIGTKRVVTSIGKYYFNGKKVIGEIEEKENFHFDKSFYLNRAKDYLKDSSLWKHW
jgi:hypothetical protein